MAWCLKVNRLSKVTPRILGCFTVGTFWPFMKIGRSKFASFEKVVKMVADDYEGEINRFLSLNQLSNMLR